MRRQPFLLGAGQKWLEGNDGENKFRHFSDLLYGSVEN